MKTDARVSNTKSMLKNALLTCLTKKEIGKITVSELCKVAGLNRTTFYKHYKSCDDLLKQIQEQLKNSYVDELSKCNISNSPDFTDAILSLLENDGDVWSCIVLSERYTEFVNEIIKITKKYCLPIWKKYLVNCTDIEMDMLLTLFTRGILYILIDNYHKNIPVPEIRKFVKNTMKNCLKPYIIEKKYFY